MCLYIGNKKGHIAVKDIVCFKALKLIDGKYKTPWQGTKVTLGEYLIPDSSPKISEWGFKYKIGGGVIHAYLDLSICKSGDIIVKAIIKKGTRFWLQDDLGQIAAEKLFITEEKVTSQEEFDYNSLIPYASKIKTKDGYKVSLEDVSDYKDVLGVYTSRSLVSLNLQQHNKPLSKTKSYKFYDNLERAREDYDGSGNTKNLDVKYLGDHEYIPSLGELNEALLEMAEMNIVRKILGREQITYLWFWSSTMKNKESTWICYSNGNWGSWDYNGIWYNRYVLPFLELS